MAHHPNRFRRTLGRVICASSIALLLSSAGESWAFSRFNKVSGDWLVGSNWNFDGLPNSGTDAQVLGGSTVIVSAPGAVAGTLALGFFSAGGNLNVTGSGVLSVSGSLSLYAGGSLTVQNGGTLNLAGSGSFLGSTYSGAPSVNASLTITGIGSTFNISSGPLYLGTGAAIQTTISAGGVLTSSGAITLGESTSGASSMTVTGAGSKVTTTAGLTVGGQNVTTPASLTISDGGQVSNTTAVLGAFNSRGSVTVTDAGSRWDNNGTVFVGTANTNTGGTLLVQNGAAGSSKGLNVGVFNGLVSGVTFTGNGTSWVNTGTLNLNAGMTLDVTAGAQFSSSGQATIGQASTTTISGTGSSWSNPAFMRIESTAVVKVLNGATVTSGQVQIIQGATGSVAVSGTGSSWSASGSVSVGGATTTDPVGTTPGLLVSGGAAMSAANLIVAGGTLRVTGAGSSLSAQSTSAGSVFGQTTPSFISIDTGAVLNTTGATASIAVGAAGTLNITGTGSTWNAAAISVGQSAEGIINITAGGKITSTSTVLGVSTAASGSRGTVLISGANSQWDAGTLTAGKASPASITVNSGGKLISTTTGVGDSNGGAADVIVTGPGSQWTSGNLSILNGSTVTVADGASLTVGGGTGTITLASGLGNTTAQKLNIGSGGLVGTISAASISSNGSVNFNFTGSLDWNIPISGYGAVTKAGSGKLTLSTANTNYTGFTATGGTVRATNPLALSGALSFSNTLLELAYDTGTSFLDPGNASVTTTFGTDGMIVVDRNTPGAGVMHSLGTFIFGGSTLTVNAGSNVTSGIAGLKVNSVTLSGPATFNVGTGTYFGLTSYSNPSGIVKTGEGTLALGLIFGPTANVVTINGGTVLEQAGSFAAYPQTLTVNATAPGTTASYQLDNISHTISSLTLGGAGGASTSRNNVDTGDSTLSINGNIVFDAASNPLGSRISGAVYFNTSGQLVTVGDSTNAATDLTISADILGGSFTKNGAGTLEVSGDNFFAGDMTVAAGTLRARANAGALGGSNSLTLNGGTLELDYDTNTVSEANLFLGADATITASRETAGAGTNFTFATFNPAAHTLNFSLGSNITSGKSRLTFDYANFSGTAVLNPAAGTEIVFHEIRNGGSTGSLNKIGQGTLILDGENSYSGQTAINEGKAIVSGSLAGTLVVAPGAVVASGHNLTSATGSVTVSSDSLGGGTLAPGDTGGSGLNSIGRLNIDGGLTLGTAATTGQAHLTMELGGLTAGSQYDQISLDGPISLFNARLDLSFVNGFGAGIGNQFFLLTGATSLSGFFSNQSAPNAASGGLPVFSIGTQQFAISYQASAAQGTMTGGHDIALLAIVPEPGAATLLLSGIALLGLRRRRKI